MQFSLFVKIYRYARDLDHYAMTFARAAFFPICCYQEVNALGMYMSGFWETLLITSVYLHNMVKQFKMIEHTGTKAHPQLLWHTEVQEKRKN